MKVVFSKHFEARYPTNLVENPDHARLPARALLEAGYEFAEPTCASMEDICRVHGLQHVELGRSRGLYDAAAYAVGGAICAAELALQGKSAFVLLRPPGAPRCCQPGPGDVIFQLHGHRCVEDQARNAECPGLTGNRIIEYSVNLHEMRNDPFKGNVIRLKPPLQRFYRKRIGNDRVLFSIRGEDVYLELMGDRSFIYELAKKLERNK